MGLKVAASKATFYEHYRLNLALKIIITFYAISPLMYILRALFGDEGITSIVLRLYQPLVILLFIYYVICKFITGIKLPSYFILLFILAIYGMMAGFISGNELSDIAAGLFHFISGLAVFLYFYNLVDNQYQERFLDKLALFAVIANGLGILLIYLMPSIMGINVYLGLACQVLLIVFFYKFHNKSFIFSVIVLALIVLSGKRGVLVALALASIVFILPYFIRSHLKNSFKLIFVAFIFIAVLFGSSQKSLQRLTSKFEISGAYTMNSLSSGRSDELSSATSFWLSNYENTMLGYGFGYTYTYEQSDRSLDNVEKYKNVHFSYLNPLIIFGLLGGIVYYIVLCLLVGKAFLNRDAPIYYKVSLLAYLIYACFVFNLFSEIILWMILGMLCKLKACSSKELTNC